MDIDNTIIIIDIIADLTTQLSATKKTSRNIMARIKSIYFALFLTK
jgi:hypothetical protein